MATKPKKAKPKNIHEFELTVVGLKYRLSERDMTQLEEAIEEQGGITCKFEREPDNEVDAKAVKVITLDPERKVFHNLHIGYVRRPGNASLNDLLRKGATIKMCLLTEIDIDQSEGILEVGIIPPLK